MNRTGHWLQPAGGVIDAIGGVALVAEILDLHRSTVWSWTQPKSSRGTDGYIPSAHIGVLYVWARKNGKTLPLDKLVKIPNKLPAHAARVSA